MGHVIGVQPRFPLLDVDLWEFLLSLPADVKFPRGISKGLVRTAMADRLPPSVLQRPKVVFDDVLGASTDYDALQRWILDSPIRFEEVDYPAFARRLADRNLSMIEIIWANALASGHAFLEVR